MSHDSWTDRLSDYLDGALSTPDRSALEAHLAECAECSCTLDELRVVVTQARSLPDRAPEQDLWPEIEKRLVRGRAISAPPRIFRFRLPRHVHLSLPQALAAGFALVTLSGGLVWWALSHQPAQSPAPHAGANGLAVLTPPVAPGGDSTNASAPRLAGQAASAASAGPNVARYAAYEAHYDQAIAELEHTVREHRSELDTSTVRVVEQNLVIIDHAIEQARRALERDPGSPYLHQHLALQMKLKLDLLRRTAAFAGPQG